MLQYSCDYSLTDISLIHFVFCIGFIRNRSVVSANLDTTGYFSVNRITNCSVSQSLLTLHLFEVHFSVKQLLCMVHQKSHFHQYTRPTRAELEFELCRNILAFTSCLLF